MSLARAVRITLIFASLAALAGCAMQEIPVPSAAPATSITLHGRAMGGQQPVSGATVKLYKVSTSGDGTAASSIMTNTGGSVTTGSNGSFSITGDYSCGSATEVFLVVTGGNPGSGTNANLTLMAALGLCSSLSSSTTVTVNELSTVAAVAGLEPYMSSPTSIGSSTYDAGVLAADFTTTAELVTMSTGASPGTGIPSNYTVPTSLINTLGDIIAPCVNSTGGTAGDGTTACGFLFSYATPPGGTAPTDTTTAVLDILNHPTLNTSNLFNLINASAPFQPSLASAPSTFTMQVTPPAVTVTRTFYVFGPDTPSGITGYTSSSPLITFINSAQHSIDMTMYELEDTTFSGDLVTACGKGIKVRVILSSSEKSNNSTAYSQLNGAGSNCSAVYSNPAFTNTHQKTITIDSAYSTAQSAILTLNLQTQYYSTSRDFAEVENDPYDVAAIEATFTTDWNAGGNGTTYGTSDFSYVPGTGDNELIWSPTNAQASLVNMINNATTSIYAENEEMSATNIVNAFENACTRGVKVYITMTNDEGEYDTEYAALVAAKCYVNTYVDNSSTLYIHAKAIVADYGTSGVAVYMGSINFSTASMTENRELGMYVTDATTQGIIYNTLVSDFNGGTVY